MKLNELLAGATDAVSARRVFGEPIQTPRGLIIPVARVAGGAGGGGGEDAQGGQSGSGGGSGFYAVPVGIYRVADDRVSWHPAVDVTAIVLGVQLACTTALLIAMRRR